MPETSTARPEVAAAASSAAARYAGRALLALAPHVEERVVDADREPDQQDDLHDVLGCRRRLAREREQPGRGRTDVSAEQQRDQRRRRASRARTAG